MIFEIATELTGNKTLWVSVLSFFIAQLIKIIRDFIKTKRINLSMTISSGGMPSSHSAFVASMTTAIGLNTGFDSGLFAVSAIISMVVMYDAAGVRRAAGKQAATINMLVEKLGNPNITLEVKLKELLGHSPIEVAAGAVLGIVVAVIAFA